MLDEESAAKRWGVRLVKVSVVAGAATIVVWYALQFRPPHRPPTKSPTAQLAILRNGTGKAFARRIAAEAIEEADATVIDELKTELSKGDDVGREMAAIALGRVGNEADGALDALIAALDDPRREVRHQAAISLFAALRRLGDAQVRRLSELLARADAEIRLRSAIELGRADGGAECFDALRGALEDSDPRIRAEAYAALARHEAISLDELIAALHDADPLVQITACTLLSRMGSEAKPAIDELARLVAAGPVAWSAAPALLQIAPDDPEILSHLTPLFDSDDKSRLESAAMLFHKLGRANDDVRWRLLARVDDPREYVADYVLDALWGTGPEGRLRPPELIDALEESGDGVLSLQLHHEEMLSRDFAHGMPFYYPSELHAYGVTDRDLARLGDLRNLRLLDLSGNPVGDAGLAAIADLRNLEWLLLYDTKITSAGLAHLGGMTRLRSLALCGCEITDDGLQHLEQLPALEALDLRRTKITDAGMRRLAGLKTLKAIWLEDTQVTDAGLAPLAELPLLEDLGYLDKQFTLRGLAQLKQLATLRPPPESVVDDDLALLAGMPRLRTLILSGAPVTDAGLEHVGKLTQLESLWLNGTKITDAGLPKLRSLVNLKHLYLPSSGTAGTGPGPAPQALITDASLEALQQSLPKLEWPLVRDKNQFSTMNPHYEVVGLKAEDETDDALFTQGAAVNAE